MEQEQWDSISTKEKKVQLYQKQKALLDNFLQTEAIGKAQHDRSLGDLIEKMGMQKYADG